MSLYPWDISSKKKIIQDRTKNIVLTHKTLDLYKTFALYLYYI